MGFDTRFNTVRQTITALAVLSIAGVLTLGSTITGDLKPTTDATYDIGSSALRWKDLYASGTGTFEAGLLVSATDTSALAVQDGNGTEIFSVNTAADVIRSKSTEVTARANFVLTGSIDPATSSSVTGVGTKFLSEVTPGDWITVSGETRMVKSVTSDTALSVDVAFSNNSNDSAVDDLPVEFISKTGSTPNFIIDNDGRARVYNWGATLSYNQLGNESASNTEWGVLDVIDGVAGDGEPYAGTGVLGFFQSDGGSAIEVKAPGGYVPTYYLNSGGSTIGFMRLNYNAVTDLSLGVKVGGSLQTKISLQPGGAVFGGDGVMPTVTNTTSLYVPDGYYPQFEDNNAGAPAAGDCDSASELGRISIDTTNNRLYVCMGATRLWDYVALTN